jgi:SAM-dependent methyltransferase
MKSTDLDSLYRNTPPDKIPWNREAPPDILVSLVESGEILPCKAIDLGCGAGNYSVWLAKQGFDVTGVDLSPAAIELAKALALKQGVTARFIAANLLDELKDLQEPFEFALEWDVLHHIFPNTRKKYVTNVGRLLAPGAKYLSACFAESDPNFGGVGKVRKTPIGTMLYFSSKKELRQLFTPLFRITALKEIEVPGNPVPHKAMYALMERKE